MWKAAFSKFSPFSDHVLIMSCSCEKSYQVLPAFLYCKRQKAGRGLGTRLGTCGYMYIFKNILFFSLKLPGMPKAEACTKSTKSQEENQLWYVCVLEMKSQTSGITTTTCTFWCSPHHSPNSLVPRLSPHCKQWKVGQGLGMRVNMIQYNMIQYNMIQ